jgi:hypothetical protein
LEKIVNYIRLNPASIIAVAAIAVITGCAGGHGNAYKDVVSPDGKPLMQVCVVPLYQKGDGMSFGPDGKGGNDYPGFYLRAPYAVNSGDDFVKNLLPSKRMIPPFIAFGTGYYAPRSLLVKRGYLPLLISDSDIYSNQPLTLTAASPLEAEGVIAMLTAKQPNQEEMYNLFHIQKVIYLPKRDPVKEMVHVEFDDKDISLLQGCK